MSRTYHIGLRKNDSQLIVEVADTVDQLSCELWKYLGERETTLAQVRRNKEWLLKHINEEFKINLRKITIKRIAAADFTAGHLN